MYNVNIQLNYKKIKITHCGRHNPKIAPVAPLQDSPGSGVHVLSPGDSNTHLGIAVKRFCKYRYGSKSVSLKTGRVLVGLNLLKTRFSLAVCKIWSQRFEACEKYKVSLLSWRWKEPCGKKCRQLLGAERGPWLSQQGNGTSVVQLQGTELSTRHDLGSDVFPRASR